MHPLGSLPRPARHLHHHVASSSSAMSPPPPNNPPGFLHPPLLLPRAGATPTGWVYSGVACVHAVAYPGLRTPPLPPPSRSRPPACPKFKVKLGLYRGHRGGPRYSWATVDSFEKCKVSGGEQTGGGLVLEPRYMVRMRRCHRTSVVIVGLGKKEGKKGSKLPTCD